MLKVIGRRVTRKQSKHSRTEDHKGQCDGAYGGLREFHPAWLFSCAIRQVYRYDRSIANLCSLWILLRVSRACCFKKPECCNRCYLCVTADVTYGFPV